MPQGVDLDGEVSFHGSLAVYNPVEPGAVTAQVLVLNSGDDPFVSAEAIEGFKQEMDTAGADYEFVSYPGAVHSFTNPGATARGEEFGMPLACKQGRRRTILDRHAGVV